MRPNLRTALGIVSWFYSIRQWKESTSREIRDRRVDPCINQASFAPFVSTEENGGAGEGSEKGGCDTSVEAASLTPSSASRIV